MTGIPLSATNIISDLILLKHASQINYRIPDLKILNELYTSMIP
jgi:hypothetical protein